MNFRTYLLATLLALAGTAQGEVKITSERIAPASAEAGFKFTTLPSPLRGDAARKAVFTVLDGERDGNGGNLDTLHDGRLPANEDDPKANFFLRGGKGGGGRLLVDLGNVIDVKQINTFSWHANSRGPQVYRLYGSDGKAAGFEAQPHRPVDPVSVGWKLITNVDTRPKDDQLGGQYGVSIADSAGSVGSLRYLLFDVASTESADSFGETFFSEIDVIDASAPNTPEVQLIESVPIEDGGYRFTVDTTEAPDLTDWAHTELIPVMKKWYPLIVNMLPSEGYSAPKTFSITFTNRYKGVAAASGNRVECDPSWYRKQLKGEALGSLVHELVHVVQRYGRRPVAGALPNPVWLTEGIADYLRWYHYEPQSRGADIRPANAGKVHYYDSYRVTANFLNWVSGKYDKDLLQHLNAALREGRYQTELWKKHTNHTVEELAEEWKKSLAGA